MARELFQASSTRIGFEQVAHVAPRPGKKEALELVNGCPEPVIANETSGLQPQAPCSPCLEAEAAGLCEALGRSLQNASLAVLGGQVLTPYSSSPIYS